MIKIVMLGIGDGLSLPAFLGDTDTGYYGKDILRTPGVYEEETGGKFDLQLVDTRGNIGTYSTGGMFLIYEPHEGVNVPIQDVTKQMEQYLTVPETAAKMLLRQEDEDTQDTIEKSLATLKFYAGMTINTKVFLPESSFEFLAPESMEKMRSTRHVYVLDSTDNLEIVQENCTSNFGIVLPELDDIHSGESNVSPLDILRVVAPCRRDTGNGIFAYNGIYHTPYFKVDKRLRGGTPSYLEFLNGYTKNDTLEVQPNERHMYDNLYTLVCADVAKYTVEIMTGVFFQSKIGQHLRRLCECREPEVIQTFVTNAGAICPDGVKLDLTFSAVSDLMANEWVPDDLAKLVKSSLTVDMLALDQMLNNLPTSCQAIDTGHLPFILDIDDAAAEQFTNNLIKRGVVTRAMLDYLVDLCKCAYEVNWGHTGAARAIPGFIDERGINIMSTTMAAFLGNAINKIPIMPNIQIKALYPSQGDDDDDDDMNGFGAVTVGDNGDDDDKIKVGFNYYIATETARRIQNGSLPSNYFTSQATGAETTEVSIVEYWRSVNGEDNLRFFLTSAYAETGDIRTIIECFLKLMRWGSVKPAMLVLENYPNVKVVFDLNLGKEAKNTTVVDESQLQLVNGCKYSLQGFMTCKNIISKDTFSIVGFILSKNYGEIQKTVLASLVDVGEMYVNNSIDIAELKSVQTFNREDISLGVNVLSTARWELYTSDRNIKAGIKYNTRPANLSEVCLLMTPDVLESVQYLKAKHAQVVVTTKDRQYQILSTYVDTLKAVSRKFPEYSETGDLTTVNIREMTEFAYKAFDSILAGQAPDVNESRAGKAVNSMNLDLGGGAPTLKFDTTLLEGKFTIVSDVNLHSELPSIEFTDAQLQAVSRNDRIRNRIILLILVQDGKFIFCRKDLKASEVKIRNKSIDHQRYETVEPVMKALLAGKAPSVRDSSTGTSYRAVLHESLKEFLQ